MLQNKKKYFANINNLKDLYSNYHDSNPNRNDDILNLVIKNKYLRECSGGHLEGSGITLTESRKMREEACQVSILS